MRAAALLLAGMLLAPAPVWAAAEGDRSDSPLQGSIWQQAVLDKSCWGGMVGCEKRYYASVERLKRRIIFGDMSRGVDKIEIACTGGAMSKEAQADWVIELPVTWRNCSMFAYGDRGATFSYRLSE